MLYKEYTDYGALVELLMRERTEAAFKKGRALDHEDTFSASQHETIRRALTQAIAEIVTELSFEELTRSDILPEEYRFYEHYDDVLRDTPCTFWDYVGKTALERRPEVLA